MSEFVLHPRLGADTLELGVLDLSEVRILNDRRFPWLVLVPRRAGLSGLHHLAAADRPVMIEEIAAMADLLDAVFAPDRINVGALGNLVPQLHVHVVARTVTDPAWPGPVWGCGTPEPYGLDDAPLQALRRTFRTRHRAP